MKMSVLRITPHRNVRNNETRRLYSALHDLFSPTRTNRVAALAKRLYGASAESVSLWWIVRIVADEDDKKRIEYFTAMPESYVDAYKTKFRGHEGWKSCTVESTDQFEQHLDMAHTDLYRLGYKRHDMFSLEFNYSDETMPIEPVMSVVREMKEGEFVTLYMRMESVDRMKWKKSADYAWEQWKKGHMVHRAGLDPARLLRSAYELGENGFHKLHNGGTAIAGALGRQFFNPKDVEFEKKEKPKHINHDREELLVNGDLSTRTKNKRNMPVFKTSIRFTVTSADPVRREMLARSLASAYEHTAKDERWKDNVLVASKIKLNAKKEMQKLAEWYIHDLDPLMMSVDEVGKLCQLPTAALQEEFKDYLESNQRTEIEIPKRILREDGILVGTATDRGVIHNVHIPVDNPEFLYTGRGFAGAPGMGKDQAMINLIVEAALKHGIGAVVPDFIDEQNKTTDGKHWKGMANAIRDALPPEMVIDLNLADTMYAIRFGLESVFKKSTTADDRIVSDAISEILAAFLMNGEGDDDRLQTMGYLKSAAKVVKGDLLGVKLMFTSDEFREQMIEKYEDMFDMDRWIDYGKMSDGKRGQIYGPVMQRLNQILESEYLYPMFGQREHNKLDFYELVKTGKVIIFRVKSNGFPLSDRIKELLAYWIMMNFFLIKLALDGEKDSVGTFYVMNEPHQYLSDGLIKFTKRALVEGRKYRFAPIIAFHSFRLFDSHPEFVDVLMSGNVNWHLFKNSNEKFYDRMMIYLSDTFESTRHAWESTKALQYIACWTYNGEYMPAFLCDALPMVGDRHPRYDNSRLTREHIKKYGRPIKEVIAEYRQRNKMSFAKSSTK